MVKFNNKMLAESFFWFGIMCTIFGIFSQYSERIWIVPAGFYLQIGVIAMLGGIFAVLKEKY